MGKVATAKWVTANKGYHPAWEIKKYGLSLSAYLCLCRDQNSACAICKQPNTNKKRLAVDHCHTTGKVRGLLCTPCNLALGSMRDNPVLLRKAADYLEV